jgi:hypothetical protein
MATSIAAAPRHWQFLKAELGLRFREPHGFSPANLREWERQPFFLTLIAKKWLPQTQLLTLRVAESVVLDF